MIENTTVAYSGLSQIVPSLQSRRKIRPFSTSYKDIKKMNLKTRYKHMTFRKVWAAPKYIRIIPQYYIWRLYNYTKITSNFKLDYLLLRVHSQWHRYGVGQHPVACRSVHQSLAWCRWLSGACFDWSIDTWLERYDIGHWPGRLTFLLLSALLLQSSGVQESKI